MAFCLELEVGHLRFLSDEAKELTASLGWDILAIGMSVGNPIIP